jgi:hypothetical protein
LETSTTTKMSTLHVFASEKEMGLPYSSRVV